MSGVDSIDKYSQMMRWLTRPQSKVQEPRIMDQAALSDDVVPGALKDEIAGNFEVQGGRHCDRNGIKFR